MITKKPTSVQQLVEPSRVGIDSNEDEVVILKSIIGANLIVDRFSGERLPRIC